MLFAVSEMDATVRMLFLGAAVVAFALAAFGVTWGKVSMIALGLALFAFPPFWDALAAT